MATPASPHIEMIRIETDAYSQADANQTGQIMRELMRVQRENYVQDKCGEQRELFASP